MPALPKAKDVQDILHRLLDIPVEVRDGKSGLRLSSSTSMVLCEYVDPEQKRQLLLVADLPFACRSGAALTRVPGPVADESIRTGKPTDNLRENFDEIANIFSGVFAISNIRLILHQVLYGTDNVPAELKSAERAARQRATFDVQVGNYGTGRIAVIVMGR